MAQHATAIPFVRNRWIPMTYEEFLDWAPDGMRTEWSNGAGVIYSPSSDRHQALIFLLMGVLDGFVHLHGLGRVSMIGYPVKLSPDGPHREPDVVFVATAHLDGWTPTKFHGAADLIIEVLSEDTATEDRIRKRQQYEAIGVPEYIMIDSRPRRFSFTYLRIDEHGVYQEVQPDERGRYHSVVVPGFWLDPDWFRREPFPRAEELLLLIAPDAYRKWLLERIRTTPRELTTS